MLGWSPLAGGWAWEMKFSPRQQPQGSDPLWTQHATPSPPFHHRHYWRETNEDHTYITALKHEVRGRDSSFVSSRLPLNKEPCYAQGPGKAWDLAPISMTVLDTSLPRSASLVKAVWNLDTHVIPSFTSSLLPFLWSMAQ